MESLPVGVVAVSVAVLVLISLGAFIGYALGVRGREEKLQRAKGEIQQVDGEYQRALRILDRMKTKTRILSNFMVCMPEFARQINTNHEPKRVPPMIVGILEQMFSPKQIVVFYADEQRPETLYLTESKGFLEQGRRGFSVKVGEGRLGWVAENQITMDRDEFAAQERAKWATVSEDPTGMRLDLYAPMIHDNKLVGVIGVGGLESRHPEEKKMLKMVADLGSSALSNAKMIEKIKNWADQDGLTNLLNKRAFVQKLGMEIFRCERERSTVAVFIFDIDHFKNYNDSNGHLAGDEVLRAVGRLLRKSIRADDLVARYGGEEFIAAMPNTELEGAVEAAQKIRRVIEEYHFPNQENQPTGNLTISGGISIFPMDGRNVTELIGHADQALYQAKARGRNQVIVFESPRFGADQEDTVHPRVAE